MSNNPPLTVSPELLDTTPHPDLAFITKEMEVIIMELTIPFNSSNSMSNAHSLKATRKQLLLSDLETTNHHRKFLAMKIGSLGHSKSKTISSFCHLSIPNKPVVRRLFDQAGKLAITASCHIFIARKEPTWISTHASPSKMPVSIFCQFASTQNLFLALFFI